MKRVHVLLGSLAFVGLAACSGDGGSSSGTSSSSSSGGSSSSSSSSSTSSSSGGTDCPTAAVTQLAAIPPKSEGLLVGTAAFFTLDRAGGADLSLGRKAGALVSVPRDGSATQVAYTSPADTLIVSAFASGDHLFVAQAPAAGGSSFAGSLVDKNTSTGTVTDLVTDGVNEVLVSFIGVDDNYVYFAQSSKATAGNYGIYRAARSGGGGIETVAEVASTAFGSAQLEGSDIWFSTAQGAGAAYKVPKNNAGAPVTSLSDRSCLSGYRVTNDAVYCGGALDLSKLDRSFGNPQPLLSVQDASFTKGAVGPRPLFVASDAVYARLSPSEGTTVPIVRFDRASGRATPTVCGRGVVSDIQVEGNTLYWLETKKADFTGEPAVYKVTL